MITSNHLIEGFQLLDINIIGNIKGDDGERIRNSIMRYLTETFKIIEACCEVPAITQDHKDSPSNQVNAIGHLYFIFEWSPSSQVLDVLMIPLEEHKHNFSVFLCLV